jgi:quinol monooxygenase YgiN
MSTKNITVVASLQAKPGREAELKHLLQSLLEPTRKERGCLQYELHVSPTQPEKFLFLETWASQEALDAHLKSPHLTAALPHATEWCAVAPGIEFWEKVA